MGTCGHSLIIRDLYMYNLKVYTSKIYVVNYGDTVANHGSVYRPCLNYQMGTILELWIFAYLSFSLFLYIYTYTHIILGTSTGNRMF